MLETEQRKPVVERQGYNTMSAGGTGGSVPQISQEQKDRWTQTTSPGFETPKPGEVLPGNGLVGDGIIRVPNVKGDGLEETGRKLFNGGSKTQPSTPTNPANPTTPTAPTTPANPANPAAPQTPSVAGNNLTNGAYNTARLDAIQQMYDAQRAAREAELKSAYDLSLSRSQAAQEQIAPEYQRQANEIAAQNERNRQNFLMQAAASGLNTGTGAQESLARQGQYLGQVGSLRTAEADAQAAIQRQQAELQAKYQSDVAAALAENDYQRAGAMLDEYNNAYQRDLQNAQNLAQYGDFSLFAQLYGQEQADNMFALWVAQNPDLAYNSGRITEEQYEIMTGKKPVGFSKTGATVNDLVNGRLPEGFKRRNAGTGDSGGGMDWEIYNFGTWSNDPWA